MMVCSKLLLSADHSTATCLKRDDGAPALDSASASLHAEVQRTYGRIRLSAAGQGGTCDAAIRGLEEGVRVVVDLTTHRIAPPSPRRGHSKAEHTPCRVNEDDDAKYLKPQPEKHSTGLSPPPSSGQGAPERLIRRSPAPCLAHPSMPSRSGRRAPQLCAYGWDRCSVAGEIESPCQDTQDCRGCEGDARERWQWEGAD